MSSKLFGLTSGIAGAVFCGALVWRAQLPMRPAAALPDYGALPAFSLIDQQGRSVTREDLAGSVWVADFIFTRCAGQCPRMSAQMASLQAAFSQAPQLRLVSFTVDPVHDTPAVLDAYARRFGAGEQWRFVTGPREAITALATAGFHLGAGSDETLDALMTHSVRFALVDARGHLRGTYDAADETAIRRLTEEARRLLREGDRG